MSKKFYIRAIICFGVAIILFQFGINIHYRIKPPSNKWSKEVLISSVNIRLSPKIIKYNNNYVIVYNENDGIKAIVVDKLGNKLKEKVIINSKKNILDIDLFTSKGYLYITWLQISKNRNDIECLKLDNKFNVSNETEFRNVESKIGIGNDILAIAYNNRIELIDMQKNKKYSVTAKWPSYLSGIAASKNNYMISYKENDGKFYYLTIKNGAISKPKYAGSFGESTKISFIKATLTSDKENGYIVVEYRYEGSYGLSKILAFSLKNNNTFRRDLYVQGTASSIGNSIAYNNNGNAAIISESERVFRRKEIFNDIVQINIKSGEGIDMIPISRNKEYSMYPAGCDDIVIYYDLESQNKYNLYMTSTNEAFKKAHNGIRLSEIKLALQDTIQGIVFSIIDVINYGSTWILISICFAAVVSLFEYRVCEENRKYLFIITYLFSFCVKAFFVHYISYNIYKYFIPTYMPFYVALILLFIISLLCGSYGYIKYKNSMQSDIIALNFTQAILMDTLLTQLIFVPFLL